MPLQIVEALITAIVSMAAGSVISSEIIQKIVLKLLRLKEPPPKTYSERLSELMTSLNKASSSVDAVLQELARVARDKESSVRDLETELVALESKEKEMQAKIEVL